MLLNDICKLSNIRKQRKRVGRGIGSGNGKTSGRGHKGAGSRSGNSGRLAFEGGQTPVFRRVAKKGHGGHSQASKAKIISLSLLSSAFKNGDLVDSGSLHEKGIISRLNGKFKILATGILSISLTLKTLCISRAALQIVRDNGGSVQLS